MRHPDSPFTALRTLLAAGKLGDALRNLAPDIAVAGVLDGRTYVHPDTGAPAFSADTPVEVGCVARNLTSLLFAIAVSEGRLGYDDPVASFFPSNHSHTDSLRIHHLLNFSHGLDGSSLDHLPYKEGGHIDGDLIWSTVSRQPHISLPGERYYYYGSAGIWLAAAILERTFGTTYAALLAQLVHRLGIDVRITDGTRACPASGGFRMSGRDLLELCLFHLSQDHDPRLLQAILQLRTNHILPLPPWSFAGEGVAPGWFCYRGESFGMLGQSSGHSLLLLISPDENAALVLTGRGDNTANLARRAVIGPLLHPRNPPLQRMVGPNVRAQLRLDLVVGRYGKANLMLHITCGSQGDLHAAIYRRSGEHIEKTPLLTRTLIPTANYTFFPSIPETDMMPYIKLDGTGPDEVFMYAMTGKHTFRRIA